MSPVAGMSWAGVSASVDRHLAGRPPAAISFSRNPVFRAPSSGLPYSGVVPRGRSDELEMDRPGTPRGAGAAARSTPNFGRGGGSAPASLRPVHPPVFAPIGGAAGAPRSPLLAKANLANGAQAAVVKLASYGSGPTSAAALLGYQSHHGELALERQDGTMVVGAQEVADVAASWEGSQRAPSNDVLSFRMTIEGSLTREEAQAGLQEALKGHSYAWTYSHEDEAARIDVVMVAASSERDPKGHLERVYANEKSIGGAARAARGDVRRLAEQLWRAAMGARDRGRDDGARPHDPRWRGRGLYAGRPDSSGGGSCDLGGPAERGRAIRSG